MSKSSKKKDFSAIEITGTGFMKNLNESIPVKARFNTGFYWDIITGRPYVGIYGDTIVNGGIAPYTGVVGGANLGKSTLMDTFGLILACWYDIPYLSHNNEADAQPERIRDISYHITDKLKEFEGNMSSHPLIKMLDNSAYPPHEMHEHIRELAFAREERSKEIMRETPFLDDDGKPIYIIHPFAHAQDSLSAWSSKVVHEKMSDNETGSKENQTFGLMHGMSKTQMIAEFPSFCARAGMMFFQTAHLGPKYQLNPYAPARKKLEFMAGDIEIKFTSNNFNYLPNNLWWVMGSADLMKKAGDGKYYPEYSDPNIKIEKDTDLRLMTLVNLRGKNGPSGIPFELVYSQSQGFIPYLSNFRFCRESDSGGKLGFGISGTDQSMYLDLYPDVKFSRFNLREKFEADPRLRRAARFTADLCILTERMKNFPRHKLCTPEQLYNDLKDKFDWNEFLDTRDRWTWTHYEDEEKYLSIYDLLNFRLGETIPYWHQEEWKKKYAK